MINIEDLFISQPALCAIASIDEFRGRWQGRGGIDETLAARLKERALNESVAAIANPAENRNYRQLLEQIVNHSGEIGLFETSVKKLHKLLLCLLCGLRRFLEKLFYFHILCFLCIVLHFTVCGVKSADQVTQIL